MLLNSSVLKNIQLFIGTGKLRYVDGFEFNITTLIVFRLF